MAVAAAISLLAGRATAAPSGAELEQAGNLFSITCSSSFCHGEGGIGARGPSLRNRDFTPDFVRNTILNGRSGTPMPAFKDALSQAELSMIVAYVMSLSPENHAADTGAAAPEVPEPAAIPLSQQAQFGSTVFFDAARSAGCALCHSYSHEGGPIGPDLSTVAKKAPRDIYQSIVKPAPSPDYPQATVTTRDGKTVTGVPKQKTEVVIQLYDLSSVPPVLRSFYPADGVKTGASASGVPYAHDLSGYSKDEVAALIAFLKSADGGPPKDVTPQELAQP